MAPVNASKATRGLVVGDFRGREQIIKAALENIGFDHLRFHGSYARLPFIIPPWQPRVIFCNFLMEDDGDALDMLAYLAERDVQLPPVVALASNGENFRQLWDMHHISHAGKFTAVVPHPFADEANLRLVLQYVWAGVPLPREFLYGEPAAAG